MIFGTGGVGMNAVQGAAYAGAKHVIAVDPNPFKQEMAGKFGATFTTGDPDEALEYVRDRTRGRDGRPRRDHGRRDARRGAPATRST